MFVRSESTCPSFTANDGCQIKELMHPNHMPAELRADLGFSLAVAEVAVGASTYRHVLEQHEVYYLIEGHGLMHVGTDSRPVTAGDAISIPAGDVQWIENTGRTRLRFVAVVCPPWAPDGDRRL